MILRRVPGIDATNLISALELACTGSPTKIDVGRMNDQYFINVASAGFGAEVTATTHRDMKGLLGGAAYSIMGFVRAFQLKPYKGRLILPGGVVKEGSMLIMTVGNSRFAGGGYEVAPQAILTDGLLDVAIVIGRRPDNLSRWVDELREPSESAEQTFAISPTLSLDDRDGKPPSRESRW